MKNIPITCLEQLLSYDVAANILCTTVDDFAVFTPKEAAQYIDCIELKGSSVRVKAQLPGGKKRIQLVIGIVRENELDISKLISDKELRKIQRDKAVRRLNFVWIVTNPADYSGADVKTYSLIDRMNEIGKNSFDAVTLSIIVTRNCSMQL